MGKLFQSSWVPPVLSEFRRLGGWVTAPSGAPQADSGLSTSSSIPQVWPSGSLDEMGHSPYWFWLDLSGRELINVTWEFPDQIHTGHPVQDLLLIPAARTYGSDI